jgi:hypothetical protein
MIEQESVILSLSGYNCVVRNSDKFFLNKKERIVYIPFSALDFITPENESYIRGWVDEATAILRFGEITVPDSISGKAKWIAESIWGGVRDRLHSEGFDGIKFNLESLLYKYYSDEIKDVTDLGNVKVLSFCLYALAMGCEFSYYNFLTDKLLPEIIEKIKTVVYGKEIIELSVEIEKYFDFKNEPIDFKNEPIDFENDKVNLIEHSQGFVNEFVSSVGDGYKVYTAYRDEDKVVSVKDMYKNGDDRDRLEILEVFANQNYMVEKFRSLLSLKRKIFRDLNHGMVDDRRIHKILFDDDKVMKSKKIYKGMNSCLSFLLDYSGSMERSQSMAAVQIALLFADACNYLNIPYEIVGFTTSGDDMIDHGFTRNIPVILYLFKSFTDKFKKDDNCLINSFKKLSSHYTIEGEGIIFACDRLLKRNEKRKILIVLNDGIPEGGMYDDNDTISMHLKNCIKKYDKLGVEFISIGCISDCVKEYYKNFIVYENLDDMVSDFYKKITDLFLKIHDKELGIKFNY